MKGIKKKKIFPLFIQYKTVADLYIPKLLSALHVRSTDTPYVCARACRALHIFEINMQNQRSGYGSRYYMALSLSHFSGNYVCMLWVVKRNLDLLFLPRAACGVPVFMPVLMLVCRRMKDICEQMLTNYICPARSERMQSSEVKQGWARAEQSSGLDINRVISSRPFTHPKEEMLECSASHLITTSSDQRVQTLPSLVFSSTGKISKSDSVPVPPSSDNPLLKSPRSHRTESRESQGL